MARHPAGNPDLVKQHIDHQREGDKELGQDTVRKDTDRVPKTRRNATEVERPPSKGEP